MSQTSPGELIWTGPKAKSKKAPKFPITVTNSVGGVKIVDDKGNELPLDTDINKPLV